MSYSFRVASPPTDPPERNTIECTTCEGRGEWLTENTPYGTVRTICQPCDGTGEVEVDKWDNPYEPDTWREAEGLA